jgi:hypothetical protein
LRAPPATERKGRNFLAGLARCLHGGARRQKRIEHPLIATSSQVHCQEDRHMRPTATLLVISTALILAGCVLKEPRVQYAQSRAIDADIDATHVVGPTATSPARTQTDSAATIAPWRNEEQTDHLRALREQLAQ